MAAVPRKTRRVFNLETAIGTAHRDSAVLKEYPSGTVLNSRSIVDFTCRCGAQMCKRLDSADDYGMVCKPCGVKRCAGQNKRKRTRASSEQGTPNSYKLIVGDNEPVVVDTTYCIDLVLAPHYHKILLRETQTYFQVRWWDIDVRRHCQKCFRKDQVGAKVAAESFRASLLEVPSDYHVQVSMAEAANEWRYGEFFRVAPKFLDWPRVPTAVEAYAVGTWLGDGSAGCVTIHNIDEEILAYWRDYCDRTGVTFSRKGDTLTYNVVGTVINGRRQANHLTRAFRSVGLLPENLMDGPIVKHIPEVYKKNCREVRLQIVAGLLDTDGSLQINRGVGNTYDFIQSQEHEKLFDDLKEVVESLGLKMTKSRCVKSCTYLGEVRRCPAIRGSISGTTIEDIPVLVERKKATKKRQARHDLQHFRVEAIYNSPAL
jgi:hypothetical protein